MKLIMHILGSVQADEIIGFLLFTGLVAAVYITAAAMLIELGIHWRKGVLDKASRSHLLLRRVIFTLAGLGLVCMGYGFFVEPYWLSVSRVKLASAKLPPGSGPLRIVQISDLHCDPSPRLEDEITQAIAREKPDLIVFTGDAINSESGLPLFKNCLARIAKVAPTFVVKGNWDSLYWHRLDLFGDTGAKELAGEPVKLMIKNVPLWITGAPIGGSALKDKALQAVPAEPFTVFLYHYPSGILEAAERRIDLVLAGHTHGGQVALPGYGALITLSRLGKRFESGLYRVKDTWLYVNRGIGMEGGLAPRVRFCARPEITVFDLSPGDYRPATPVAGTSAPDTVQAED